MAWCALGGDAARPPPAAARTPAGRRPVVDATHGGSGGHLEGHRHLVEGQRSRQGWRAGGQKQVRRRLRRRLACALRCSHRAPVRLREAAGREEGLRRPWQRGVVHSVRQCARRRRRRRACARHRVMGACGSIVVVCSSCHGACCWRLWVAKIRREVLVALGRPVKVQSCYLLATLHREADRQLQACPLRAAASPRCALCRRAALSCSGSLRLHTWVSPCLGTA